MTEQLPRRRGRPTWATLDDACTMRDLDHLTDNGGPLSATVRGRVYSAVVERDHQTWVNARLTIIDARAMTSLWQAVVHWGGFSEQLAGTSAPTELQVRQALHGVATHIRARSLYEAEQPDVNRIEFDRLTESLRRYWYDRIAKDTTRTRTTDPRSTP